MMILWLLIYAVVVVLGGFALAASLHSGSRERRDRSFIEWLGLSVALGSGAVPILLSWLSMAGLRPSRPAILVVALLAVAALMVLERMHRLPGFSRPALPLRPTWSELLILIMCGGLIGMQFAAIASAAIVLPLQEWDAIAIWGLKAKVLFYEPLRPRPEYFNDLTLSFSHLDYPLLVPMLWAGAYGAMGTVDDRLGKAVLLLPILALVPFFYAAARELLGRWRAAVLTAILVGLPVFAHWAAVGLADAALAMFIFAASFNLVRWVRFAQMEDGVLAGLFSAMAGYTKLEGLVTVASTSVIITTALVISRAQGQRDRNRIVGWLGFMAALIVAIGPWLIFSASLPHTHEDYGSRLLSGGILHGLPRLHLAFNQIRYSLKLSEWGGVTTLLVFSAILGWRGWGRGFILTGWAVLLIQLLAYIAIYLVTPWDLRLLVPMTAERLLLHVAPLAVYLCALHWQEVK